MSEASSPIYIQPPLKKPKVKAAIPRASWDNEKIFALLKLRKSTFQKKIQQYENQQAEEGVLAVADCGVQW